MEIQIWPLDRIKPYPRNARKIPQKAIDKVALSLERFGWQQPLVLDKKGVIVAGHTRWLATKKLGWTEAPVHVASKLTPAQIRAYRLMDNRSHQESDWDFDILGLELAELKGLDLDLELTGFESRELDTLLRTNDEKADEAPPLPEVATSRTGDLWLLGRHRLLCGDATDSEAVKRVCGEAKPFLMVTDPPFGVSYDPAWRDEELNEPGRKNRQTGIVKNDDRADWTDAWKAFPGDVAYVWHSALHGSDVARHLQAADYFIRAQIIWRKQSAPISRGAYHWQHEPCWYAVRKGKPGHWKGDRTQTTVWDVQNLNPMGGNKDEVITGHATQKPLELMRRPILNHTEPGDVVYDPFVGSGTTLIAAELTERVCVAIDIDSKYVDVVVERWQQLTGGQATLEADGRTFEQMKAERVGVAA